MWLRLLSFLVGYLLGSFPTGVILTRRKFGIDVREMGSGNIGATNVTRVFGWYAGVLVFVVDFMKGAIPVWMVKDVYRETDPWMITAMGVGLVTGHCYSIFLRFRGGKGVATSFGCLAVLSPPLGAITGVIYLSLLAFTKISALGSLGGLLTVLIYLVVVRPDPPFIALALAIAFVVLLRHQSNISRLITDFKRRKS